MAFNRIFFILVTKECQWLLRHDGGREEIGFIVVIGFLHVSLVSKRECSECRRVGDVALAERGPAAHKSVGRERKRMEAASA